MKIEAQVQEAAALKLYTEKYKEPPPLNFKIITHNPDGQQNQMIL